MLEHLSNIIFYKLKIIWTSSWWEAEFLNISQTETRIDNGTIPMFLPNQDYEKNLKYTFVQSYKWLGLSFSANQKQQFSMGTMFLKFLIIIFVEGLTHITNKSFDMRCFSKFQPIRIPYGSHVFLSWSRQIWKCSRGYSNHYLYQQRNHIDLQIQRRFLKFQPIRKKNCSWLQCFYAESGQNKEFVKRTLQMLYSNRRRLFRGDDD